MAENIRLGKSMHCTHMRMQFSGLHTNLEMFNFHDLVHYLSNWTHVKFMLLGLGYWFGVTGVCFS